MAAPTKNEFWKLRSTHGREKLFATPALLWEAACEYFAWCQANPLIEIDFVGPRAKRVRKPKMRAFTMQGLCRYLCCNTAYFDNFKASIKDKEDEVSKDYSSIIALIKDVMFEQKFSGAAAGQLNSNLIARELGLADKAQLSGEGGGPIKHSYKLTLNL